MGGSSNINQRIKEADWATEHMIVQEKIADYRVKRGGIEKTEEKMGWQVCAWNLRHKKKKSPNGGEKKGEVPTGNANCMKERQTDSCMNTEDLEVRRNSSEQKQGV